MKPLFPGVLAWLVMALVSVAAVPARLPYEPPEAPQEVDLAGSHWFGTDYEPNFSITFEKDGTLSYGYNQNSFKNGSWKLEGQNLYFEMNKKYREFRGTVQGNVIQGDSWNVTGKKWQTHFSRVIK